MATMTDLNESYEEYLALLETAKKFHFSQDNLHDYFDLYVSDFTEIFKEDLRVAEKTADNEQLKNFLLYKLNEHKLVIVNLIELKSAKDEPKNNPARFLAVQNNEAVKKVADEFIPTIDKMIMQAWQILRTERDNLNEVDHLKTLALLNNSLEHTKDLITSKFNDPKKLKILLNDAREITDNRVNRYCRDNPAKAYLYGILSITCGIGLAIAGAIASTAPGGLILGIPMIAAGIALTLFGKKLCKESEFTLEELRDPEWFLPSSKAVKKTYQDQFGDQLKKIVEDKKILNTFAQSEKFLDDAASQNQVLASSKKGKSIFFKTNSASDSERRLDSQALPSKSSPKKPGG